MKNLNLPKLLLSLSLLSLHAPTAEAAYRPKKVGRYNGPAIPTGTRSACDNTQSPHSLTPIAPVSHIGQTATPNPSVTWYVPEDKPYPLIFRLWDNNKILWQTNLQSQPGLMTQKLPIALTPQQIYRWQIVLVCNPNRPSQNQVTSATIIYIPTPLPAKPTTRSAQTTQLSEAELWYDAFNVAKDDRSLTQSLLSNLKTIETEALTQETPDTTSAQTLEQQLTNLTHLLTLK